MAAFFIAPVSGAVTSADQIYYDSNSGFFDGKTIVVQFDSRGGTDGIDVFYPNRDLGSEINKEVQSDFNLQVTHNKDVAEYTVSDTGRRPIYRLNPTKMELPYYDNQQRNQIIESNCFDLDGDGTAVDDTYLARSGFSTKYGYAYEGYCYKEEERVGGVGRLNSPDTKIQTTWVLSNGKQEITKTISNDDTGQNKIANFRLNGETVAKVRFNNLMTTGSSKEQPLNELALHSNKFADQNGFNAEGWKIISESDYNSYTSYLENGDAYTDIKEWGDDDSLTCFDATCTTRSDVDSTVDRISDQASASFASSPLSLQNSNVQLSGSGFGDGLLTLDMDERIAYPSFTVYLEAGENGYIVVDKPVGVPEIVSSQGDSEIPEIGSGTVSMTVENVGTAQGSFSGRVKSCTTGFSPSGISQTVRLDPGESTTYDFRVSFSSSDNTQQTIQGECTLQVTETGSGESRTTTVDVGGVQENECTKGKRYVRVQDGLERIVECTDGFNFRTVEVCGEDEHAALVDGKYQCTNEEKPPVTGECERTVLGAKYTDPVCKLQQQWNGITGGLSMGLFALDLLVGVTAFLGGLLGGLRVSGLLGDTGVSYLQREPVQLGIGVLVGVLAAVAAYSLFSSIVVKILVVVLAIIWIYIQGLLPW